MNQSDIELLATAAGKQTAEIGTALAVIVAALKQQPSFDSEAFNKYITGKIANAPEEMKDGIALAILNQVL